MFTRISLSRLGVGLLRSVIARAGNGAQTRHIERQDWKSARSIVKVSGIAWSIAFIGLSKRAKDPRANSQLAKSSLQF